MLQAHLGYISEISNTAVGVFAFDLPGRVWGVMFGSIPWIKKGIHILRGVDVTRLESG